MRQADVALSTRHLAGIDVFDPQDGVLHAGAGTKLSEIREHVNAEGWDLPLDPPGEGRGASLGGALSTSATGPRRQGLGAPRDCVLGLDVVLASGELTRCGGRVVKNVTGYDIAKLYTGAFGTLGVIASAWLRLRPLPQRVVQRRAPVGDPESAIRSGVAMARRYTARAVAVLSPALVPETSAGSPWSGDGTWGLFAEFAGDAPAVEQDAAGFDAEVGGDAGGDGGNDDWVARVTELHGAGEGPRSLRARIAALPSRLPGLCTSLRRLGGELVVYPGMGLVYAVFEECDAQSTAESVYEASSEVSGSLLFEAMSQSLKARRDVFAAPESTLPLMRELKRRFDSSGVLNPGRFAGGI